MFQAYYNSFILYFVKGVSPWDVVNKRQAEIENQIENLAALDDGILWRKRSECDSRPGEESVVRDQIAVQLEQQEQYEKSEIEMPMVQ